MPAATTSNAVYDLGNRLTSWNGATVVNDNNGNLTSDGTFTYTYNPRNQLTLVKQGNQTRGSYTYDGLGRRVVRTIGNSTTKPAYDGWNLVQERASNGNSVVANYLTGLGLDQPFVRTAGSSTSYYLSDALGSIVGLASTTGTVPTTYTYEPYGKTTMSGTASASFFGFTGRENDSTGTLSLYNYRARAYSAALQRFLTEDPIQLLGGDANLYRYVGDAPTVFTDPFGMDRGPCSGWSRWACAVADIASGVAVIPIPQIAVVASLVAIVGYAAGGDLSGVLSASVGLVLVFTGVGIVRGFQAANAKIVAPFTPYSRTVERILWLSVNAARSGYSAASAYASWGEYS